jgi:hypothetical protein
MVIGAYRYPQLIGAMSTSISLSRASPLEPAHDPERLRRILTEMRAMVCRIFYHSLALWSAGAVRVLVAYDVPLRCNGSLWYI